MIEVTAPPDVLAARLAARGRETAGDIAARLARGMSLPSGIEVVRIVNDSLPETAAEQLLHVLVHSAHEAPSQKRD